FCGLEQLAVANDVGYPKIGHAGLTRSKKFAGAAQFQVEFGDFETIIGADHCVQAALAIFGNFSSGHENAIGLCGSTADPAAKLVQLRQTESLSMFDYHDVCVGHIDANLDDGRGNQNLQIAFLEHPHDLFFEVGLHAAMQYSDPQVGKYFLTEFLVHLHRGLEFPLLILFNDGVNDIRLVSSRHLLSHKIPNVTGTIVRNSASNDRSPPRRQLVDDTDIQVTVERERQGARNRRSCHYQDVRFSHGHISGLLHELESLQDAETMLLVDDDEAEIREVHVLFDQRMRSNDQLRVARGNVATDVAFAIILHRAS